MRIYDNALEQHQDGHWIRFEVETKYEQAMRLINAMIDTGDRYGEFFGGYALSALRFINNDDTNVTRCSVKAWWAQFCGTIKRYSLRIAPYVQNSVKRMEKHLYDYMSANITTVISSIGLPEFIRNVTDIGAYKLKQKHFDALKNYVDRVYTSFEHWKKERPISLESFMAGCI